ncbi:hypothetical protein RRG08_015551 [Elysia crispata]|uniref:Uncharacterized protein n=1 Tax=Elysia crispata TaxID=231223 RepID=A0AAE0YIR1_9GAST|nr:hypothetical protein RRG08_015551 [Elysia crispata]
MDTVSVRGLYSLLLNFEQPKWALSLLASHSLETDPRSRTCWEQQQNWQWFLQDSIRRQDNDFTYNARGRSPHLQPLGLDLHVAHVKTIPTYYLTCRKGGKRLLPARTMWITEISVQECCSHV